MITIISVGPTEDERGFCVFARAVIVVDVVGTCCGARALQFYLAPMAWTPTWHPVHTMREGPGWQVQIGPVRSTTTVDNSTTLS